MTRSSRIAIIVALAIFIEYIDSTVLMISLPALARDFNVTSIELKLAINAYFIGMGIFLPLSGWVADRFGAVNIFRWAIATFVVGSLFCAMSQSLSGFVAARFLQGLSAAMMVPIGRVIVYQSAPKSDYIKALNLLTMSALLGPIIGPAVGGYITTYYHWRWIFIINLPISILLLFATMLFTKFRLASPHSIDWKGFMYSSAGLITVAAGLSLIDGKILPPVVAPSLLVIGIFCFGLYWQHFLYRKKNNLTALLDLSFLTISTFRFSSLGGALFRVGAAGSGFLLPLMLQEERGFSAVETGYIACASAIGAMAMKMLSFRILVTLGYRRALILNTLFTFAVMCSFALPISHTSVIIISIIVLLNGFFTSLQFTSLNSIAYADLENNDVGGATSLTSIIQLLASITGIAVAAVILQTLQETTAVSSNLFSVAICVMAFITLTSLCFIRNLNKYSGNVLLNKKQNEN
ncbi:MFS transporter [Xenorhabdus bovienii]|uniref:MFS transporter n=1 Tax=Xenorhabdus bovienii TaxID=40576 RepID=UPI003DA2B6F4